MNKTQTILSAMIVTLVVGLGTTVMAQETTAGIGAEDQLGYELTASGMNTWMDGNAHQLVGARATIEADRDIRVGVGGWYSGAGNAVDGDNPALTGTRLRGGYAGVVVDYTALRLGSLGLYGDVLLGAGHFCHDNAGECVDEQGFWVVEPGAGLRYQPTNWLTAHVGAAYRLADPIWFSAPEYSGIGVTGGVGVRF